MKNLICTAAVCIALIFGGCKSNNIADAKIFERKEVDSNRLLIKYKYSVDGKEFIDSARIDNVVLEGDIIPVQYNTSTPEKAIPQIEK